MDAMENSVAASDLVVPVVAMPVVVVPVVAMSVDEVSEVISDVAVSNVDVGSTQSKLDSVLMETAPAATLELLSVAQQQSTKAIDELFDRRWDYTEALTIDAVNNPQRIDESKHAPPAEATPKAKDEPPIDKSTRVPGLRIWKNPSGKEVEGTLVRVLGETVEFRTKAGKVVKTSVKFFSEEDQAYIKAFEHLK